MPDIKIVLVGGGSYSWGPNVLSNVLGNEYLNGSRVVLHDIHAERLDLNYRLALKYKELTGSDITFEQTTDQAEAFEGADYVVVTISTGRLKTMRVDVEIPEKYGIFQPVGDTVGPGGLSRALRNVPVFLDMAHAMEQRCPNAWMLNVSNPLSALSRVVNRETGIRAIGVCHGVRNVIERYARTFDARYEDCAFVNTGIDHCAWLTHLFVGGRSAEELLVEMGIDDWLAKSPAEAKEDETLGGLYELRCGLLMWRHVGCLPAISDRHIVEFLPNFIVGMDNVEKFGVVRTTIADRESNYARAQSRTERMLAGDEELKLTGGSDNVAGWIAALDGGPVIEDNLNAPNTGQIPQLPADAIVETRGILDKTGVRPIVSPMPEQIEAIIRPHVLREELTVEAALEGDFDKALAVLAGDPLLPSIDVARPMLEEMLAANKAWLPQFAL
jgi:alpha-galactosidase/6-phospho-beta-glucosidase family protein